MQLFLWMICVRSQRGSFYHQGSNMKFSEEAVAVRRLIGRIAGDSPEAKRLIFCGSSSAVYIGTEFRTGLSRSYMVVGGPQYFLGQSLLDTGNIEALKRYDRSVRKRSNSSMSIFRKRWQPTVIRHSQRIYLHYSDSEHTYEEHIRYLRRDLAKRDTAAARTGAHYKEHGEISLYFSGIFIT